MYGLIADLRCLRLIIFLGICSPAYSDEAGAVEAQLIKEVVVSCDLIPEGCQKDGSGLYFELIRAIYELEGIKVTTRIDPFIRGLKLVREQKVDFVPTVFKLPAREQIYTYPNIRIATEYVSALRHKDMPVRADRQHGTHVTYIRGYEYSRFLAPADKLTTVLRTGQGVRMVIAGRSDYFINPLSDTYIAMTALAKEDPSLNLHDFKVDIIEAVPTYLIFQKNQRGERLANIYDKNFKILYKEGKVKELFYKSKINQAYYNFPELVGYELPPPDFTF